MRSCRGRFRPGRANLPVWQARPPGSVFQRHRGRGALLAAVVSALAIGFVTLGSGEREDSIINTIWATGMAVGLLFIYLARNHTTSIDPMSYLMGDILIVSSTDLWIIIALDVVVVLAATFLNHKLSSAAKINQPRK